MKQRMLNMLTMPQDIKRLDDHELTELAAEIREYLIESVAQTGGHLASNLGVVEITLAMHRVFSSPEDRFIFDVGHQCYVHKILTGRKDDFCALRKKDGLSGFPNPEESPHDPFKMGHSSTSLSLGLGLSYANYIHGEDHNVVALIGDGSMTGGLAYEALSNIRKYNNNLVIILNDNQMSISKNVGFVAQYLSKIRAKPRYFRIKDRAKGLLNKIPLIGEPISNWISDVKNFFKILIYRDNLFENFGLTYLGPVDGHDIRALTDVLERAKQLKKPVLIHAQTKKGKGYSFAEHAPQTFHGISSFDVQTGLSKSNACDSFSSKFGELLCHKMSGDPNLYVVTAAMCEGCGLEGVAEQYPKRIFDVGIAEEHAVTFSAGLARGGVLPVFAVYSSFLQRGYDQIIHDVALQKLHVVFAVDRCGIVGADGETHQGLFDVPFMLSVPNLTIFSPATYKELDQQFQKLCYETEYAGVIRYPRGGVGEAKLPFKESAEPFEIVCNDPKVLVISYGREIFEVMSAVETLQKKPSVLKINRILPLSDAMVKLISMYPTVIFYEEGYQYGGVGTFLFQKLGELGFTGKFLLHGIPNEFVKQASPAQILQQYDLDSAAIHKQLQKIYDEDEQA